MQDKAHKVSPCTRKWDSVPKLTQGDRSSCPVPAAHSQVSLQVPQQLRASAPPETASGLSQWMAVPSLPFEHQCLHVLSKSHTLQAYLLFAYVPCSSTCFCKCFCALPPLCACCCSHVPLGSRSHVTFSEIYFRFLAEHLLPSSLNNHVHISTLALGRL